MKNYITRLSLITVLLVIFSSCELERLESAQETAEGGGTLSTFTSYSIDATDPIGSNINGRVVFWKTSLDQTLVQISLYNTVPGLLHPALILEGAVGTEITTMMTIDEVSGDTGELNENKFFLISDTAFYDALPMLDAHINIYLSEADNTIVAGGNMGVNGDPIDSN